MPKLSPSNLQPGMVLTEDAMTTDGRVLLKKDTVLSDVYIKKLAALNIKQVAVVSPEDKQIQFEDENEITVVLPDENDASIQEKIDKKFYGLPQSDLVEELKRLAVRHFVKASPEK